MSTAKEGRLANTFSGPYLCTVYETMENCNVRLPRKNKKKKNDDVNADQKQTDNSNKVLTPLSYSYIYFTTIIRHRLKTENDNRVATDLDYLMRYKSDNYFDVKLGVQAKTNYGMNTNKWDENRTLALTHVLATCAVTATCCKESFRLMNTMLSSFIYDEKDFTVDRSQLGLNIGEYTIDYNGKYEYCVF